MNPTKTTYVIWSLFRTPQGMEAITVNIMEVVNDDLPLRDITKRPCIRLQLHTPHIVWDAENCGTINYIKGTMINGWCMLFLAFFLPKRKCAAANCYCSSYNNKFWRSIK